MTDARLFDTGSVPLSEPRSYVLAATPWADNGELILDCARLGYLRADWWTFDATYGRGKWWTRWRPDRLWTNDWDLEVDAFTHHDFRSLPIPDGQFDAATFDPPYIAPGGRRTSTVDDFNSRYGLHSTPAKPDALQKDINAGLAEVARVVRRRGLILVKCKNYVNAGALWPGTFLTWQAGHELGLKLVDCLEHLSSTGPQSQTTQEHARSNYSTALIFRK